MRNRTPMKPEATSAMKQFKMEVANELGIPDYENMDKGNLSSRENGYVGGNMTRKMVAFAEQNMANGMNNVNSVNNSAQNSTQTR
ncbi:MAG: alpha/beta-type small acid-soluble spore protein [Firmicutes bacterium]|nr:alpha/beta-type small acid-soluble spore protein [Bacillota bacterium]